MEYENVKRSIGFVFAAGVLEFFASGISLVSEQFERFSSENTEALYLALSTVAFLLSMAAYILYISGMTMARKEERTFNSSVIMIFLLFAINVVDIMFTIVEFPFRFESLVSHVTVLLKTAIIIYICIGYSKVFAAMDRKKPAKDGLITILIFIFVFAFSAMLEIIGQINTADEEFKSALTATLTMIYSVLSMVCLIKYVFFLYRAKKILQSS